MYIRSLPKVAAALGVLALMITEVDAAAPRDVDDLVGVRASSGESQLMQRGYHYRKTIRVSDNTIAYWWNGKKQACIAVTTADGRYKSIVDQPDAVCDKDAMNAYSGYGGGHHGTEDLVGMRASNGERALHERGYRMTGSFSGADRTWSNWWKQANHKCITVMTMNGRYQSITETLPADCKGEHSSAGAEAPPGGYGARAPQIMTVDNGNVSVDVGGCNVLFHPTGGIVSQGRSCTASDVSEAQNAFRGYRREQGAPAGAEAPPGGFSAQGSGSTFTCESSSNQYQYCRHPVGAHAKVRIQRQLSGNCVQGKSWGYDADGVWVNKGCRAVFEIH